MIKIGDEISIEGLTPSGEPRDDEDEGRCSRQINGSSLALSFMTLAAPTLASRTLSLHDPQVHACFPWPSDFARKPPPSLLAIAISQ